MKELILYPIFISKVKQLPTGLLTSASLLRLETYNYSYVNLGMSIFVNFIYIFTIISTNIWHIPRFLHHFFAKPLCTERVFIFHWLNLKLHVLLFNLEFMASDQCLFFFSHYTFTVNLNRRYNVNVLTWRYNITWF